MLKKLENLVAKQRAAQEAIEAELKEMREKKALPLCYFQLYTRMAERAKELGYALTLHGSLIRDCDMVGIPWTEEAVCTEEFVKAMLETSRGTLGEHGYHAWKPHGRLAWAIHLGGGPYIDLSVMPRIPKDEESQ